MDRNHFSIPRVVAEAHKHDERCIPSSQRPQYPTLYRRLKQRLACSFRASLYQRSVVRQGKKATHKCSRVEGGSLVLQRFNDQHVGYYGQLNSSSLHKQTRRNPLGGMWALLWKIMTWWHHYQITLKARHIPGCLNVMADLLSRSNQVNRMVAASAGVQTDLSKMVHSSCTSICHSSDPQSSTARISSPRPKCLGHRCSEHKRVGSHCLCLLSHGSSSQDDPKYQAIQLSDLCNNPRLARDALVLGPSAALNRDPTSTSSVKNSSETVPQLCVSQQSTISQPQLLPFGGHQQGPSTSQSGPYLRNGAEKIWWISPLPL